MSAGQSIVFGMTTGQLLGSLASEHDLIGRDLR